MAESGDSATPAKVQKLSTSVVEVSSEPDNASLNETVLAQKALEEIDSCQNEIDGLNEKASEEILQVEMKYNKLRKPHYEKRNELIQQIPVFWMTVFVNHPLLSTILTEQEEECLNFLKQVRVDEFEDIKSGYAISFHFSYNPFFTNTVIKKEYHLAASGGRPGSKCSLINWKPNMDLTKRSAILSKGRKRQRGEGRTFFSWLAESTDPAMDKIAELIKDDIWLNPLQYYLAPDISLDENGISDDASSEDDDADDSVVIVGDDDDDDDDDDVYEVEGDSFDDDEDDLLEDTHDSIEVEDDDDDDAIEVLGSDSEPESAAAVRELAQDSVDSTCEPDTSAVDTTEGTDTKDKTQSEKTDIDKPKADSSIEDGQETEETDNPDTSQTVDTTAETGADTSQTMDTGPDTSQTADTGADKSQTADTGTADMSVDKTTKSKEDKEATETNGTGDSEKGNG